MRLYFVAKTGTGIGSPANDTRPNLPISYSVIARVSASVFFCAVPVALPPDARWRPPDFDEILAVCRARRIPFRLLMERWKTADDAEADDGT